MHLGWGYEASCLRSFKDYDKCIYRMPYLYLTGIIATELQWHLWNTSLAFVCAKLDVPLIEEYQSGRHFCKIRNTLNRRIPIWLSLVKKNRHNPNRWIPIWLLLVQNYIYTPNREISKGSFSEFHPVAIWEGIMRVHVNTASTLNVLIIYSCPGQFLYHDTSSWIITGDIKPLI